MTPKYRGVIIFFFVISLLLIPIPSEALNYGMDQGLGDVDASFWGEDGGDISGVSIAAVGDVNGDGYDDILIGAPSDDDGGNRAGQTYLILGKASGWTMDTDLSTSDASFVGEDIYDWSGISVAGAGDVNGDGYDDILIGASVNDEGGYKAGQTYLILGKASGWSMDTNLSTSDASFWGEGTHDYSGYSVAGVGDVNGDGYDDILIGAYYNVESGYGAGQTYLIFGKSTGWTMDVNLSSSDASFWGEDTYDEAGWPVAGAGDVNRDGYDDFLIGANRDEDGGDYAGQTYLILGKASGWSMDTNLSTSDASFWGEDRYDRSGCSVAGAGDVNGDGYDDILIGASGNDDGGDIAGQTYLIFGKAYGWSMDTHLSASNASFWGEDTYDYSGHSVAGAGDVNGDGYDDILIGAFQNDDGGNYAGQTYLILGKSSGWAMGADLSASGASFWGENTEDSSGYSVAGARDVNGDGYDDILIGAFDNFDGGSRAGQTYLIFPDHNSEPTSITSLKTYTDDEYSHEITYPVPGDKIYLELTASDGDGRKNIAQVWVKGNSNPNKGFRLRLMESGGSTGKFRGEITIANRTHERYNWINASEGGWIEISSRKNPTILINLSIGIHIEPRPTNVYMNEDEYYSVHFNTMGVHRESWTFDTNASWLFWDEFNENLAGTPTNLDVGTFWVNLHVEGNICSDEINFTIIVNNSVPRITTHNILSILQDKLYHIDYNSTDDQQGNIVWHLTTDATWLSINSSTGVLNGTPLNEDIGLYRVNVSVSDGNDGWDSTEFTLDVKNLNDPPILYDCNLTPGNGYTSTNFTFSIMYKDIDGDEPINISVFIDGNSQAMTDRDYFPFDYKKGVRYYFSQNLNEGIHQYYFSVSDGKIIVRFPQNEKMKTPYIELTLKDETELDSDNDTYNDTYELSLGSDPYNPFSTPFDLDADGWNNSVETQVGSNPFNNLSVPRDTDTDGIPDSIDPDRDGDGVANVDDPYPDDRDRWENEGKDVENESTIYVWIGIVILVSIIAVAGVILYTYKRRNDDEAEQSSEDDLGRVEKGDREESE